MSTQVPPPPAASTPEDFRSPQWQAWFRQLRNFSASISVGLSMPNNTFTVSGSPVTNNGVLGVTYNSQSPNLALMSPASGAGTPTWRSITTTDLPADVRSSNVLLWLSF